MLRHRFNIAGVLLATTLVLPAPALTQIRDPEPPRGFAQPPDKLPKVPHGQDIDFLFGALKAAPSADAVIEDTMPALTGPLFVATPALPAPKPSEPIKNRATSSALQAFAAQIQAGDLLAAGRTLGALFDVEEPRAIACAATFAQRVRHEANFFRKVMELRSELHNNNLQRALLLLLDCFGLSRGESAEILRNLQRRKRIHG